MSKRLDKLAIALIYNMVREYARHRAEKRSEQEYDKLPRKEGKVDWTSPAAKKYSEAQAKVATDAFLAIRGRNAAEFINYFTGTICAVGQGRSINGKDNFFLLAEPLQDDDLQEDIKNLTMLALSAQVYRSFDKSNKPTTQQGESS